MSEELKLLRAKQGVRHDTPPDGLRAARRRRRTLVHFALVTFRSRSVIKLLAEGMLYLRALRGDSHPQLLVPRTQRSSVTIHGDESPASEAYTRCCARHPLSLDACMPV